MLLILILFNIRSDYIDVLLSYDSAYLFQLHLVCCSTLLLYCILTLGTLVDQNSTAVCLIDKTF